MTKAQDTTVDYEVIRGVMGMWLIGWYIKAFFFFPYLFSEIVRFPVRNNFFPAIFASSLIAQIAYILPGATIFTLFKPRRESLILSSQIMVFSSAILMWHQDTYNDATFVSSFWVALWLGWVSINLNRLDENLRSHARVLAVFILALFFMGGFTGKLTPEYWNGQIFYNIFIGQEGDSPFLWLKKNFTMTQVQLFCTVVSRFIIGIEMFLAFSLFFPFRLIRESSPWLMGGITLFSTWRILSVLSCLMGMIWFSGKWSESQQANGK